jgi:hypothetical protein
MRPMLVAGAIVVLDRPYISFAPYRAHQRTLAVRCGAGLVLGNVEFDHGRRILRPLTLAYPPATDARIAPNAGGLYC